MGIYCLQVLVDLGLVLLQFGGTSSSYPALKRNGTTVQVKTADDASYSNIAVSGVVFSLQNGNDANQTISFSNNSIIILPVITASRTLTISSAVTGAVIWVHNKNTSAFNWSFATTVKDAAGNTITNLASGTIYQLFYDGSIWYKMN